MPKCYILSGAPLSGKSTWARKKGLYTISCDDLRLILNNGKYVYDPAIEKRVWDLFYVLLKYQRVDFIVDNTNCKEKYINEIKKHLPSDFEVEIVKFEIPLWKSYIRNVWRYIWKQKWIPFKVIKDMKRNYKQLWK